MSAGSSPASGSGGPQEQSRLHLSLDGPSRRLAPWCSRSLEGIAVAALLFWLYAFLALDIFYGDGSFLVHGRATGQLVHENHLLSYAVISVGQAIGRPFAADLFEELAFAMRLYTALAVWVVHRTLATLGMSAMQRIGGAMLFGTSGAVLFYATAIERQAPFLPFAALAFHALVWCGQAPSARRAVVLGLATGLATAVHATGHLLFALVVPWLLAACERQSGGLRAAVRACGVAGLAHAALVLAAAAIAAAATGQNQLSSQTSLVRGFAHFDPGVVVFSLVREWLLPFLPGSLLGFAALLRAPTRRLGCAILAAFLPYQTFTLLVLRDFDERGAYNLPLILPLVVASVRLLPARLLPLAVIASIGCGAALNREYARTMPHPPTRQQIAEITAGATAVVLFVGPWALRPILRHQPGIATVDLFGLAVSGLPWAAVGEAFDRGYEAARAAGRRMLIAQQCLDDIRGDLPMSREQRRFFDEHFLVRYRFVPAKAADFRYATIEAIGR